MSLCFMHFILTATQTNIYHKILLNRVYLASTAKKKFQLPESSSHVSVGNKNVLIILTLSRVTISCMHYKNGCNKNCFICILVSPFSHFTDCRWNWQINNINAGADRYYEIGICLAHRNRNIFCTNSNRSLFTKN